MITYKGYYIKPHKLFPNNVIVVTEGQGGKIPNILTSMFTSVGIAKDHIDKYLVNRDIEKERVNASKTRAKSGG